MLSETELRREAAATGFQAEALEKVIGMFELLEGLRSHPFLKSRLALKGGTALNLFLFDVPRLSIDLDLNYVGAAERESMLAERPQVEQAIQAVCGRLGLQAKRVPDRHAGGKWRLSHTSVMGRPGVLELDVNFLLRTPLWAPTAADSKRVGSFGATQVPMLDVHEIAAGKLGALFGRAAIRDLFDAREMLVTTTFDDERLRLAFVVYGGINRRDWRTVTIEDVRADSADVDRQLVPLLRSGLAPARTDLVAWTERLVAECRERLAVVLPLRPGDIEFLDRLNDRGDIVPELLTTDERLGRLIRAHPGLKWKALNVRNHWRLAPDAGEA